MNALPRWIAFASAPAVLALHLSATHAFTDSNAELKEVAADRPAVPVAPVVTRSAGARPAVAWVPLSAKSLDGFRPVLPEERLAAARGRATQVAQAGVAASAVRR
ncbi:MAG: hypothetical protein EKK53_13305 [Burkholderiales bacterium]|nr:MAG: hypothetical protein EKK53_13305 [Burkholderiales bacterium]